MINRNEVAGRISLSAALKYSRWTLPNMLNGIMISKITKCGVQYHGLRKLANVRPKANVSLVKGFREWSKLSRFT